MGLRVPMRYALCQVMFAFWFSLALLFQVVLGLGVGSGSINLTVP